MLYSSVVACCCMSGNLGIILVRNPQTLQIRRSFTMYALWKAWLQKNMKPKDSQPRFSQSMSCVPLKLHTERRQHLTHYHPFHLEMAIVQTTGSLKNTNGSTCYTSSLCITTACVFTYNPHYLNYL